MAWEVIKHGAGGGIPKKSEPFVSTTGNVLYVSAGAVRKMSGEPSVRVDILVDVDAKRAAFSWRDEGAYSSRRNGRLGNRCSGCVISAGTKRLERDFGIPRQKFPLEQFEGGLWGFSW